MEFVDHIDSENKKLLLETKQEPRLGMHSFHRYYGKLIPAIPRAFIRKFTNKGDLIFDPFSGSGTTALEAKYLDRNFIGVEINPLSVMFSKVKTSNINLAHANELQDRLIKNIEADTKEIAQDELPFVVNRDHWFKDFVQADLAKIRRNIEPTISEIKIPKPEALFFKDFLLSVLSAIVKQVSNADTMHVFPGVSKRMKRLEEEGKIKIDVLATFKRALAKRIKYYEELGAHDSKVEILQGDSTSVDLSKYTNSVDLVVTNPPYISSVRYAETLKLELYWMGITKSPTDYFKLSDSMIGNDHIATSKCAIMQLTGHDEIDDYIRTLFEIDKKQAKVVYDYFTLMEQVIKRIATVLKKTKKLVMKISDSKIRKIKIPTGYLLTVIAEKNGFKLIDVFNDKINENSRSLLTSRNTYSDIILEDNIIFWERV